MTHRPNEPSARWSPWFRGGVAACLLLWVLMAVGCAALPKPARSVHGGADSPAGRCADFFAAIDRQTQRAGVMDAGYARIDGYPYLRTDRFLASLGDAADTPAAFSAWVDRLQGLDRSARRHEIANWTPSDVLAVDPANDLQAIVRRIDACGDLLKAVDLRHAAGRKALQEAVTVPDEYLLLRRVLGLYPLTRFFVLQGVDRWHKEARGQFSVLPPAEEGAVRYLPVDGSDAHEPSRIVAQAPRDSLGVPLFTATDRLTLFGHYAPVWEVQTRTDDDRPGAPTWRAGRRMAVDIRNPQTYTLLSFTRFRGDILTQLNYIIWFPSRPKQTVFDIYGGWMDGINFRVTLDLDGTPLLYETIHNCGCFYKAYPTKRLEPRESQPYAEPPLILAAPAIDPSRDRAAIFMDSRTHYVRRLYPIPRRLVSGAQQYAFTDYDTLRSLPLPEGGRRSLFDQYGAVPGTDRLERFILWPTGVLSPGAMRQWGRQAVALIGKRHFDDPFYLEHLFVRSTVR